MGKNKNSRLSLENSKAAKIEKARSDSNVTGIDRLRLLRSDGTTVGVLVSRAVSNESFGSARSEFESVSSVGSAASVILSEQVSEDIFAGTGEVFETEEEEKQREASQSKAGKQIDLSFLFKRPSSAGRDKVGQGTTSPVRHLQSGTSSTTVITEPVTAEQSTVSTNRAISSALLVDKTKSKNAIGSSSQNSGDQLPLHPDQSGSGLNPQGTQVSPSAPPSSPQSGDINYVVDIDQNPQPGTDAATARATSILTRLFARKRKDPKEAAKTILHFWRSKSVKKKTVSSVLKSDPNDPNKQPPSQANQGLVNQGYVYQDHDRKASDSDDEMDSLQPRLFTGGKSESSREWWKSIEQYARFKDMKPPAILGLIGLKLDGGAKTWLERLPDSEKDTVDNLKKAFEKKFALDEDQKGQLRAKVWASKQRKDQSVDQFIDQVERQIIAADLGRDQIIPILKNGFRTYVRRALAGRKIEDIDELRTAARAAEGLEEESGDEGTKSLQDDVKKLMAEIRGGKTRVVAGSDQSFPSNAAARGASNRVPDIGNNGPINDRSGQANWSGQGRSGFRGRNSWRGNGHAYWSQRNLQRQDRVSQGNYAQGNRYQGQQGRQYQQNFNPAFRANYNLPGNRGNRQQDLGRTCGKCGGRAHAQGQICPAHQKTCNACGGLSHFAKVCRNVARQQ